MVKPKGHKSKHIRLTTFFFLFFFSSMLDLKLGALHMLRYCSATELCSCFSVRLLKWETSL